MSQRRIINFYSFYTHPPTPGEVRERSFDLQHGDQNPLVRGKKKGKAPVNKVLWNLPGPLLLRTTFFSHSLLPSLAENSKKRVEVDNRHFWLGFGGQTQY